MPALTQHLGMAVDPQVPVWYKMQTLQRSSHILGLDRADITRRPMHLFIVAVSGCREQSRCRLDRHHRLTCWGGQEGNNGGLPRGQICLAHARWTV